MAHDFSAIVSRSTLTAWFLICLRSRSATEAAVLLACVELTLVGS
jgi:hypothetical protein